MAVGHRRLDAVPTLGQARPRVLVGVRDLGFHQEVLDHLQRQPKLEVVGAVTDPGQLERRIRAVAPDVLVLCPFLARELPERDRDRDCPLLIVAQEMTVPVLRGAVDAGAQGVFGWPEERSDLVEAVAGATARAIGTRGERGQVVSVFGPRGGVGTTFVACQLAASLADLGRRVALVDLDEDFAGVTGALAIGEAERVGSVADLLPVAEELSPEHVEGLLYAHPRGFRVLAAPPVPPPAPIPPGLYAGTVALLAGGFDHVLLHLPRSLGATTRLGVGLADLLVVVLGPDVLSLFAARRAVEGLGVDPADPRCLLVLNPRVRGEVGPREVDRVFGVRPGAVLRFDPAVARAQARGRLLPSRGRRAGRDVRRLAEGVDRRVVQSVAGHGVR